MTVVAPIAISCTLVVLGYGLARLDQGPTKDMLKQIFTLPDVKPTFYTSEDFLKVSFRNSVLCKTNKKHLVDVYLNILK